ncbi:MAG TPA: thiolase domain-containing protein [Dehalococcoidia bacterium]|nr:thiolase domain-containing protein [Dehalococcoidia bacterium]
MARRGVSIIGIGSTPFTVMKERSIKDMATDACNQAILEAGVDRKMIQALYVGNYIGGILEGQETIAPLIANSLGLNPDIPCTKVEGACSSAGIALRQGYLLIAAGVYDLVLVAGVEKMTSASTEKVTMALSAGMDPETDRLTGLTFPGFFAQVARRHIKEYGTKIEHLAMVSVQNHANSVSNPRARFREPTTLEQVLNSRPICDPLKLFDCCPISDGAAAAVLCAADRAHEFTKTPIDIVGSGQATGPSCLYDHEDLTTLPATIRAAHQAYTESGLKPQDIDVVELHNCFTIAEIVDSEDLGFFPKGRGGFAVEEGLTAVDGKVPINPSGGLIAKGHPVGATGLGQLYEVVRQLRGDHENQVQNAEIGLVHNMGGSGTICTVHIVKRRG